MISRALSHSSTRKFFTSLKLKVAIFPTNLSPVKMGIMSHLRCSPLNCCHYHIPYRCQISGHKPNFSALSYPSSSFQKNPFSPLQAKILNPNLLKKSQFSCAGGNSSGNGVGGGSGGGNSGSGDSDDSSPPSSSSQGLGIVGLFLNGWRSRVAADPEFPFKVLMEELVGFTASVIGNVLSRPNFGLNELDFVFSTLVVASIVNFILMYMLAPTAASSTTSNLPAIFANCPKGHMFEPGAYSFLNRFGTFVYKGIVFAAVGFASGLVGTTLSNGLIKMRKKMDPNFERPNKPIPTVLNAASWAIHMGLSSNLRYQTLNGVEFLLAKGLPPLAFKISVVVLRYLNNVVGAVTFVLLARFTGSQSVESAKMDFVEAGSAAEKKNLNSDQSGCK